MDSITATREGESALRWLFNGEPGGLLGEHLRRLVAWEDARAAAWEARVGPARKPKDEIDRLNQLAFDAAGEVEKLKQDVAADTALRLRFMAEIYPHLSIQDLRDDLDRLADATFGKRGAA